MENKEEEVIIENVEEGTEKPQETNLADFARDHLIQSIYEVINEIEFQQPELVEPNATLKSLVTFATKLGNLFVSTSNKIAKLNMCKIDLEAIIAREKAKMIPERGWAGNNPEERKTAEIKAIYNNNLLKSLLALYDECVSKIYEGNSILTAIKFQFRTFQFGLDYYVFELKEKHFDTQIDEFRLELEENYGGI